MKTDKDTVKKAMDDFKKKVEKSIADFKNLPKEEQERRIARSKRFVKKCTSEEIV